MKKVVLVVDFFVHSFILFYTTTFRLLFQILRFTDDHRPPSGEMTRGSLQQVVLVLHPIQYVTFINNSYNNANAYNDLIMSQF